MPFKTPVNSTLTEVQQKALSKLNSLNTYVAAPKKQFQNLNKSQQISTFDLSTRFLDGIAGPGVGDAVLSQFTRKIFATYGEDQFLLEDIIINGLAKALDTREIYLAPQLPSGETLSNSGSTSATTSVVEYDFTGIQRERSEVNVKKAINYTYTIELETDQSKIEIKNGIPYGKRFIFGNNAGLPTLLYYRPTTKSDAEIIAKSKEETETVGFTRSATGLFYPPEGTVVDSTEIQEGGMFVKLTTNVPEKLPETFIGNYSGETGMTLDEVVRETKIEVGKYGYYDEATKVEYPPTGTDLGEIPEIRGEINGYVFGGEEVYLSNAVVEVVGASPPLSLLTDETGFYSISGLQAGTYVLKSYLENYTSLMLDAKILNEQGATTNLNFPLSLTGTTGTTVEALPSSGVTSGTTQTGTTVSDGSNYNTGQATSEVPGITGGTTNTVNVDYQYTTLVEPLQYEFLRQNLPVNAPNNNYTSILLTVTNNKGYPPATITVGPIGTGEDDPKNYLQLSSLAGDIESDFRNSSPITVDGVEYPGRSEFLYKFSVTNNANLPTYEYTENSPLAEERLQYTLTTERIVNDILYPPNGAQFITGNTEADDATFLPATGTTGSTTVVTDSVNRFVGNVEANIVIDDDILAAGLSGITDDLKNTIAETFSFKINPEDVGLSNKEYLDKYLKPVLNAGKRALVAQIIKMVFGPKEIMSSDPATQEKLLNSAACGEQMFSVSNNPSVTSKQLEFNRVQLKKQLEAGKIELTVSCQKVEIQLPENFEEQFDLLPSSEVGIPESQRPNPAESLVLLNNYVQSEMQRQRNEEDATQIRQSFFQIMIEKIMQYISVAFSATPAIQSVFGIINTELTKTGQPTLNPQELLSSPCQITAACKSGNKKDFEEKSSFSKSIIDSLYSLVLSMLIRKLISEAKAKIAKLIQEKAKEKMLKLIRRRKEKTKFLSKLDGFANNVKEKVGKAEEFKQQLKTSGLKDIFGFLKKDKAEGGDEGEVDNLNE